MMPSAHLLSVWRGVAGCGWPSSSKVVRMGAAFFATFKGSANLSFGCRAHDIVHDGADDMDGAVGLGRLGGWLIVVSKVEVAWRL